MTDAEKMSMSRSLLTQFSDYQKKKDMKVPIYKGCMAAKSGGCFCSGACKEIIGWRDKLPGEI
jgi:hypothetical protein